MKFEKRKREYSLLESEAYCLINLKGPGIPKLITYGKTNFYSSILIEELLGPNLNSLLEPTKKKNEKQLLRDVCMISLQGLDRLEHIHSKNIVHNRDITPNFLIGLERC